ncbi:DUF1694 domain-containing protein [Streptococcus sp. CCUG 71758]|uniref:PF07997 family protein n=1 Tax=Streptococcus oralis SK313 TaxID=1035190 RepID=F9Q155_STROR|nr:DUF1694 domain-containing protein [Streptococcus sp. CCUG 71758]EGV01931.1 hypothetical protein HMPREF9950_0775 [Streptococcus oralis SK313]NIB84222.1 DUF1694 domain-containing protein [Streptococcus sp. CCUG 71758]
MTDLSKQLLEKAHGGPKLNPDEQRRFLGTFEERVLGYADVETANSLQLQKGFLTILEHFQEKTETLFVKISPNIEFDKQVFYLKEAKKTNSQATIVSENHTSSPLGLVIHSNEPVQIEEKDLRLAFSSLWEEKKTETPKKSIWKKWLG